MRSQILCCNSNASRIKGVAILRVNRNQLYLVSLKINFLQLGTVERYNILK
jgi:hypothetical protein